MAKTKTARKAPQRSAVASVTRQDLSAGMVERFRGRSVESLARETLDWLMPRLVEGTVPRAFHYDLRERLNQIRLCGLFGIRPPAGSLGADGCAAFREALGWNDPDYDFSTLAIVAQGVTDEALPLPTELFWDAGCVNRLLAALRMMAGPLFEQVGEPLATTDATEPTKEFKLPADAGELPDYDRTNRRLTYKGQVVKEYRRSAANQMRVLCAFQEERWPNEIDDPLPRTGVTRPIERLNDTIKSLNDGCPEGTIRFATNGRGTGVTWRPST